MIRTILFVKRKNQSNTYLTSRFSALAAKKAGKESPGRFGHPSPVWVLKQDSPAGVPKGGIAPTLGVFKLSSSSLIPSNPQAPMT
jgi:hypothetical protein